MKIFIFALLACPGFLMGQLTFESTVVSADAAPGAAQVIVPFRFVNTGETPITITEIHSSCGCTTSELDKRFYEPGESGEIEAIFAVGTKTGTNVQHVYVRTDNPAESRHNLTLTVNVPELVEVSDRMLIWRIGEEPTAKSATIRIAHTDPIHVEQIGTMDDSNFEYDLRAIEEGRLYELVATPRKTDARAVTTVRLITDFPKQNPRRLTVNLRVF